MELQLIVCAIVMITCLQVARSSMNPYNTAWSNPVQYVPPWNTADDVPADKRTILRNVQNDGQLVSGNLRSRFRLSFLRNGNNPYNYYAPSTQDTIKAQEEADTESFVRDKIHEYYAQRTGDAGRRWMFKPTKGTTKHLREIFLGRCWDFVQKKGYGLEDPKKVNCDILWDAFLRAFAYKGPCNVTWEDYAPFFDLYQEKPVRNKVLLWSGTREWAFAYTNLFNRYVTLDDTLAGLTWCGSIEFPGVNYQSCPYECTKQKPFWGHAAQNLATRARGIVHIMLNGTRQHLLDRQIFPAFMDDSYLAQNQLPKLSPRDISEVKILVGHNLHHKKFERCNILSIKELQNQSVARGLKTTCYDDPFVIRHLLCTDHPLDSLCLFKMIPQTEK